MATSDELLDHTPVRFGKYRGKTPDEISIFDASYIVWAYENIKDKKFCSQALYKACKNDMSEQRALRSGGDDDDDD